MSLWTCPGEIRAASTLGAGEGWMLHVGPPAPSTGRAPSSEELSVLLEPSAAWMRPARMEEEWSALLRATDANSNLLSKYFTAPSKVCLIKLRYCMLIRLTHQVNPCPVRTEMGSHAYVWLAWGIFLPWGKLESDYQGGSFWSLGWLPPLPPCYIVVLISYQVKPFNKLSLLPLFRAWKWLRLTRKPKSSQHDSGHQGGVFGGGLLTRN